ncbi:uncharacterized protein LY89DRAFT_139975 [Mollisia scopiformis]|uniref:Rhodopsin domain-containing protein n=1 Tax=Mollisia scopiformis TaxID=149040 RepID=A0A194X2P7_MOLSC|nr:uncharacterized protein LY89DRAFT_139975 [Mollisia scopiformis]KUJ14456.1 hypothetical protein LY89DRAFT_139975 [Mollisia scopiformis]
MLSLLAESWTWYAFATLVICARYASRWLQLGSLKAFGPEDYVMLWVFGFYTSLVANMNVVAHLDTNLMLPTDIPTLTPAGIASRIHGSKLVLVVEQSMIMTQWGCKICLLLLYSKLTFGLKQQLAVKIVGGYVVVNLIVMEILYFGVWCRPFDQYWAVPVANEQCSAAIHHLITNAVFNISSDIMMLCIPIPLLIKSQLPRANKIILCGLFGLGIFVILCAVLNKYYSFAHPFSPMWEFWYIREASTAVLVANMPMCWSLMRRIFNLRAFSGLSSSNGQRSKSLPIATVYSGAVSRARGGGTKDGSRVMVSKVDRNETSNSWWDREGRIRRVRVGVGVVEWEVMIQCII